MPPGEERFGDGFGEPEVTVAGATAACVEGAEKAIVRTGEPGAGNIAPPSG